MNDEDASAERKQPERHGARNLAILAACAIAIATITVGVSLVIYNITGDIFLDRSRPGYIVEQPPTSEPNDDKPFVMTDSGDINKDILEEYLRELDATTEALDTTEYFSPEPISDESLL